MPVDLALMTWIRENRQLTRDEVIARLKAAGHPEQNIVDSYNAVVQQAVATPVVSVKRKEPWLAVLVSFIIPGVGHMYAGSVGIGIVILLLYGFAWLLTITIIGAVIGVPLLIGVVIWALVGSYGAAQAANRGA